jgi:putative transposase
MFAAVTDLRVRLAAWVLLQNHYHLLLKVRKGRDLSRLIQLVHGRTAFKFNELDGRRERSVWHGYWDTCIRNDNDFWTRLNYIHYNAVRHGYVDRPEDWEFSSYRLHLRRARLHDRDTHLTQKDKR